MRKVLSIRLKPRMAVEIEDEVALDEPTCLFVNGEYHVTLIATPIMSRELAMGYLLSGGVVSSADEVKSIKFRGNDVFLELKNEVDLREASIGMMNLIVTACASAPRRTTPPTTLPKVESELKVNVDNIVHMVAEMNRRGSVYLRTRGTHAAMLCSENGDVLAFAEDVGRHNAVDKVVGSVALSGGDLRRCILISTGRQSGEMVQKAARASIPIVASMTVPLTSGIRLAEMTGITLASLERGRLKVYANPQRIQVDSVPTE